MTTPNNTPIYNAEFMGSLGTTPVLNTNHGRDVMIRRNGKREWLTYVVCNGSVSRLSTHRSRKSALETAHALLGCETFAIHRHGDGEGGGRG